MTTDYDWIVVGGGIAGLMTAVRLAQNGQRVGLFEKDLLGSAASTSNHGMVHSGALYAELHPEIVEPCKEAIHLYGGTFPDAVVSSEESWFFGKQERIDRFLPLWEEHECPCRQLEAAAVEDVIRVENLEGFTYVASNDLSVASREVLIDLVLMGMHHGVEYHVHAPVSEVIAEGAGIAGVRVGSKDVFTAPRLLLCAGLGTRRFAEQLKLKVLRRLKSRIDMMVAFRGRNLDRSILCLDYGGATLAPAPENTVLASLYGGTQPWVKGYRRWAVSVDWARDLREKVERCFRDGLMDTSSGLAYMCSKTEVATESVDEWGVSPGSMVIDHGEQDGVAGLWTLIPGKMTLAFHCSAELVHQALGVPFETELKNRKSDRRQAAEELVDRCPWQHLEAAN